MGRKSRTRALSVWTNGQRVGTWTIPPRGEAEFSYDAEWMNSPGGRPLSLSLPYTGAQALKGERVQNFFDNLLPDSEPIRKRLATRFRTDTTQACDLLQAIGRDCVGAVQLLGIDETPTDIDRIVGTPMSDEDIERLLIQTTSARPLAHPGDEEDLAKLLKTQLLFWMLAAPDGHAKNFSIRVLPEWRYALTPFYDVMSIWLVEGNGANQFSYFKAKLAMALLGKAKHYHFKDIQRRHFNSTAARCFQRPDAEDLIEEVLARTPTAIANVAAKLPTGFPERVAQSIFAGLSQAAERLAGMPKV